MKEVLLTISIMVSGREETTKKCLDSLKKLRNNVPCQLILTDTGCSKEMRQWLEQEADQVISFQWKDDFAVARNLGLKAATGKWFLYLDDDEWFEDTTEIEDFFLNQEYMQYKTAFYKVRNYGNSQGSDWQDADLARMIEITPDSQFVFSIHEMLWPTKAPTKHFDAFVHHYGYAYDTQEEKAEKHKRNVAILEKTLKQEPEIMHHYMQLMVEYAAIENFQKACEVAKKGISRYKKDVFGDTLFLQALYAGIVRYTINSGDYEGACRLADEMIQKSNISPLAVATICGDITFAYLKIGKFDKGLLYFKQYLELGKVFAEEEGAYQQQQTMVLAGCFSTDNYQWIMGTGLALAAGDKNRQEMETILAKESVSRWEQIIARWCIKSHMGQQLWANFGQIISEKDLYQLTIYLQMQKYACAGQKMESADFSKTHKRLEEYAQTVVLLYQSLYRPEVLENYPQLIKKDYFTACELLQAIEHVEKGQYFKALEQIRAAGALPSEMGDLLGDYARMVGERAKAVQEEQRKNQREMDQLAEQVKTKIEELLEQNQLEMATQLVKQLQTMIPGDEELEELERRIKYREIRIRLEEKHI